MGKFPICFRLQLKGIRREESRALSIGTCVVVVLLFLKKSDPTMPKLSGKLKISKG